MPEMALVLATLVLVSTLVPSSLSQYKIVRHNPFASLTPTLAEYTVDGEDGEVLNLACPGETRIVITAASYQAASNFSNCSLSSPLLQVQTSCQRRPSCSLEVSPTSLSSSGPDPCPSLSRLAKVSYHCRPAVFRSDVTCLSSQDPLLFLSCPEVDQRILVFSAAFKGAGQGAVYCARPGKDASGRVDWRDGAVEGRLRDCEQESVTEPLVQACHGQANCSLSVLPMSLGAPSCSSLHVYIKTTFACVPKKVIKPEFVDRDTKPTTTSTTTTTTTTTTTSTTTTISTTKSTTMSTTRRYTTKARSLSTTTESVLWSESTSMNNKDLDSGRTAPHWSVLSNDLNLDILPLEQERREEGGSPGLAILIVVGATLASLLLALLLLVGLRHMRARQIPSPLSPSHHQLPPSLLPEPSLFPTSPLPPPSLFSSTGPIYSTVGRPRTLRPSSAPSPLPPELRLGWPPLDQESTLPRTLGHELNSLPTCRERQEVGTLGRARMNSSLGIQSPGSQSLGTGRGVEKISVATVPTQDWPFHPQL